MVSNGSSRWHGRAHATSDATLLRRIRTIHAASHGTYGAPRVHAELQAEGTAVARKRAPRLTRKGRLRGGSRRRFPTTTQREPSHRPADDLVGRDFRTAGPNRLWVADITYMPTAAGFLFLAVVLEVWSRRIIGWAMATDLRTRLVLHALARAVTTTKPADVVHHSDQGSQHTSVAFGLRGNEAGVRPSTDSVGDAYDNAMAEAFCAILECELLDRRSFRSQAEARMAVFAFIEGFYNPTRRRSARGYLSPIEYEARAIGREQLIPTRKPSMEAGYLHRRTARLFPPHPEPAPHSRHCRWPPRPAGDGPGPCPYCAVPGGEARPH